MSSYVSKVSSQGQLLVPIEVRRQLEIAAGTILEWTVEGDHAVVRRRQLYSSEQMHAELFPDGPPSYRSVEEMDEGVMRAMKERHARGRY